MQSHTHSPAPLTLDDYARLAEARLPHDVWDFIAGGAGDERTVAANRAAFDQIRLCPRVLTGSGIAETSTTLFGRAWSAPIGVAPLAYHTLVHDEGELATVQAAGAAGLPVTLSTFAGRAFKELRPATDAPLWLQVYCLRDREQIRGLIEAAQEKGIEALVLTVDAPHLGRRLRDLRNDFRLPPAVYPANLPDTRMTSPGEHARQEMDPALDWTVIDWMRSISTLPILLKGILAPEAARRAVDAGVDGIVVSNHGGRQLDATPATAQALPGVVAAIGGRIPVLVDGAVRRGTDVLAALALGADAVLVGRPVLHGLAVSGQAGVKHVLDTLRDELRDAMTLAGVGTVADISADLVFGAEQPPTPAHSPASATSRTAPATSLAKERLHPSLSDPDLDTMGFLNEIADRFPEAVSFAPGRPFEGFFEVESVIDAVRGFLDHLAARGRSPEAVRNALYQYGPSAGIINDLIADSLRQDEGIDVSPQSLVVTVGAQEAMLLTLRALFADQNDVLLVSTPCYVGITGAAKLLDIRTLPVPEQHDGLHCANVEEAIRAAQARGHRPRALYLVPDHSNPSGNTVPLDLRRELLDLAARHDLLLLEDSPYRLVSHGERTPTLKALDRDRRVVHIGSFAKSMFPGARVGYVVADQQVTGPNGETGLLAHELAKIKSMVTVNTSALSQAAVAGLLLASGGRLAEANTRSAEYYRDNLKVLLDELDAHFPPPRRDRLGIRWNRPSGGFFLGMHVPFFADNAALTRSAREFGVLWTPMSYFYPDGNGGERQLRLSFSALTPDRIREGVARLAAFVDSQAAR
ncbi:MAG TPA: aminotransferase class I/II-fold pyridoxal phosphate-dependent enzyme [Actinocrinis sp.]|nr:aminotransferase class I/II-fold pyridoxal phosphate-dependent enzyme [Actinocrinis sp.]